MEHPTIWLTLSATKKQVMDEFPMALHDGEMHNEQVLNDLSDDTILEVGLNTHCCRTDSVGLGDKIASYGIRYCRADHSKIADIYGCFLTKQEDLASILAKITWLISEANGDGINDSAMNEQVNA